MSSGDRWLQPMPSAVVMFSDESSLHNSQDKVLRTVWILLQARRRPSVM